MRKFILILGTMLTLASCGNAKDVSKENATVSPSTQTVEVDENLFDVTITLPNSFFESLDTTAEEAVKNQEESGSNFKSVKLNDDQSVEITMTKSDYKKMMKEMKSNVEKSLQEIVDNTEDFPNIINIESNDEFTEFTVTLEDGTVGLADSMVCLGLYLYGGIYQVFTPEQKMIVEITFVDKEGNVVDTASYDESSFK